MIHSRVTACHVGNARQKCGQDLLGTQTLYAFVVNCDDFFSSHSPDIVSFAFTCVCCAQHPVQHRVVNCTDPYPVSPCHVRSSRQQYLHHRRCEVCMRPRDPDWQVVQRLEAPQLAENSQREAVSAQRIRPDAHLPHFHIAPARFS